MRVARRLHDRAHIGREIAQLDAREPLLKLSISIPSIVTSIIGDIVDPLLDGTKKATTTTPTPTTTTAYTTTAYAVTPAATITPAPATTTAANNGAGNSGDDNNASSEVANTGGTSNVVTDYVNGGSETSTTSSPQQSSVSENSSNDNGSGNDSDASTSVSSSASTNGNNLDAPVANAGSVTSADGSSSGGGGSGTSSALGSAIATLSPAKGIAGSTTSSDPNGASNTSTTGTNASSGGISSGAITGIVVVLALILLALAIILFRKRYIYRRTERRNAWWTSSRSRVGVTTNIDDENPDLSIPSARSSFATTFEHAHSVTDISPPPPMAEVRAHHSDGNIPLFSPNSARSESPLLISFDNPQATLAPRERTSVQSVTSDSSGAQYLSIPNAEADNPEAVATPMSVRPFSPSESFAFPRPPASQSGDWSSSRRMSAATLNNASHSSNSSTANPLTLPANPFADPVLPPTTEFAEVESIRRPFESTRPDELSVALSENVRILQIFDDGWAMIEKIPPKGNQRGAQGLIPIDCFRGQAPSISEHQATEASESTHVMGMAV